MPRTSGPSNASLSRFEARFAKNFGEHVLRRGGDIAPYEVISTGSLALDDALGVGGWVEGRINEVYGLDDIGKTTLAMLGLREAQIKYPDKMVGFIDMEHKADLEWFETHGLDRSRLYMVEPDNAEQVSDQLKLMCTDPDHIFSMIVLDSIGAMIPQAEHDKDADEETVAKVAKIVTRMTKSNAVWAKKFGICLLFINQVRANINSTGRGPATITTGGWALRFGSTAKVQLKRTENAPYTIGSGRDVVTVGHEIGALVERSKVSPKGRTAYMSLITVAGTKYGPIGIDKADEAATLGVKAGIIGQHGAYYDMPLTGERIQGRDKLVDAIRKSPEIIDHVRKGLLEARRSEVIVGDAAEVSEAEMEAKVEQVSQEPVSAPQKASGGAKKPVLRKGTAAAKSASRRAS